MTWPTKVKELDDSGWVSHHSRSRRTKQRPCKSLANEWNKQTRFSEHSLQDEIYQLEQVWPGWHAGKAGFLQCIKQVMNDLFLVEDILQVSQGSEPWFLSLLLFSLPSFLLLTLLLLLLSGNNKAFKHSPCDCWYRKENPVMWRNECPLLTGTVSHSLPQTLGYSNVPYQPAFAKQQLTP